MKQIYLNFNRRAAQTEETSRTIVVERLQHIKQSLDVLVQQVYKEKWKKMMFKKIDWKKMKRGLEGYTEELDFYSASKGESIQILIRDRTK